MPVVIVGRTSRDVLRLVHQLEDVAQFLVLAISDRRPHEAVEVERRVQGYQTVTQALRAAGGVYGLRGIIAPYSEQHFSS